MVSDGVKGGEGEGMPSDIEIWNLTHSVKVLGNKT